MSKSTGNFMTLRDAIDEYGADATRWALADAGDGLEDANFAKTTANAHILKMHKEGEWIKEALEDKTLRAAGGEMNFWDKVFSNEINHIIVQAGEAYDKMQFHEVVKYINVFWSVRDDYRSSCDHRFNPTAVPMRRDLVERWTQAFVKMLSPICPHYCQHIWQDVLKQNGDVGYSGWPAAGPVDPALAHQVEHLRTATSAFRTALQNQRKKMKPEDAVYYDAAKIYVARDFKPYQKETLKIMQEMRSKSQALEPRTVAGRIRDVLKDKHIVEQAMKFVSHVLGEVSTRGQGALELKVELDEFDLLQKHREFVTREQQIQEYEVVDADKADSNNDATPGRPIFAFYNSKEGFAARVNKPKGGGGGGKATQVVNFFHC